MPRERKKKNVTEDGVDPGPKPAKKRRGSAANSRGSNTPQPGTPNGIDSNGHNSMYAPQPHMSYGGETMHASNPFDDAPGGMMPGMGGGGGPPHPGMQQQMHPNMHPGMVPNGPMGPPPPGHMHGGPPPPGMPPGGPNSMQPMMSPHNGMMHGGGGPGMGGMQPPGMGPGRGPPGPMNGPPPPRGMGGPGMGGMPPGGPPGMPGGPNAMMSARIYPSDQPMIFNPNNPNAPPIYPCGCCHKEVNESDHGILCESGCNFWFHRACTGLTEKAFVLLKAEVYAEWCCDSCLHNKNIPLIKFKP